MKKQIFLILILFSLKSLSQEYKEVNFSELTFEPNADTTFVLTKQNDELLSGKYKMLDGKRKNVFTLVNFEDGIVIGTSEFYEDEILIGTTEFKDGMQNGYAVFKKKSGDIIWKIHNVNGKKHGKCWFMDEGDLYFVYDKKVSKEEYDEYELKNNRE
ncbi:hypothetical protein [uncultured Dokdonia sp.]|uniref:hypothetical protein n=1 Tax=Dokdonia sp. R78006 TaxID=3093866 RepID=UPI00260EF626|nr:hypothetical protein [uncultured Dokdonia sp.]